MHPRLLSCFRASLFVIPFEMSTVQRTPAVFWRAKAMSAVPVTVKPGSALARLLSSKAGGVEGSSGVSVPVGGAEPANEAQSTEVQPSSGGTQPPEGSPTPADAKAVHVVVQPTSAFARKLQALQGKSKKAAGGAGSEGAPGAKTDATTAGTPTASQSDAGTAVAAFMTQASSTDMEAAGDAAPALETTPSGKPKKPRAPRKKKVKTDADAAPETPQASPAASPSAAGDDADSDADAFANDDATTPKGKGKGKRAPRAASASKPRATPTGAKKGKPLQVMLSALVKSLETVVTVRHWDGREELVPIGARVRGPFA